MNVIRSLSSGLVISAALGGIPAASHASPATASEESAPQSGVVSRPAFFVMGTPSMVGMTLVATADFDNIASPRAVATPKRAPATAATELQLPEPQPFSGILATAALALFYFLRRAG